MNTYDYEFCEFLYGKFINNIVLINSDNKKSTLNNTFSVPPPPPPPPKTQKQKNQKEEIQKSPLQQNQPSHLNLIKQGVKLRKVEPIKKPTILPKQEDKENTNELHLSYFNHHWCINAKCFQKIIHTRF